MRLTPRVMIDRKVRNRSSRGGVKPAIIVLHSTESHNREGTDDLASIASWFDNPASQASSHVVTDADGFSARLVPDEEKAWTCAGYNALSLNIEQIGFAGASIWSHAELDETARWIAKWSLKHNIPIRRGRVFQGRVLRKGVVTHKQLGQLGGGHVDPGDSYPVKRVLARAKEIKTRLQAARR